MPGEKLPTGLTRKVCWLHPEWLAVVCIVLAAILPFRLESGTDLELQFWRYGYIPKVKQLVEIRAQENTVTYSVRPLQGVRLDMRCLKHWQCLLACDGTPALVSIRDQNPECPWPRRPRVRYSAPNRSCS